MSKTKISEYSATANSNTDVASINIDEGCAPSGINNAIRAVMGHLKDFQTGTASDPLTVGGALTTSSTVTHSAGTANGVAYLNGSKVLTTGSALTFDGTGLGIGTGTIPAGRKLVIDSGNVRLSNDYQIEWGGSTVGLYGNGSTNSLSFFANTSEQMRLTSTGLGIGTSSPAHKLDVRSDTSGTSVRVSTSDNGNIARIGWKTGASFIAAEGYNSPALTFETGGTERARIDSSGNLGLGVTPSVWNASAKAIQIGQYSAVYQNASGYPEIAFNVYQNSSSAYTYQVSSNPATRFSQVNGAFQWHIAPSGTAGNTITNFTQAMTLDASGNLGVGVTSVGQRLEIGGSNDVYAKISSSTSTGYRGLIMGINGNSDIFGSIAMEVNNGQLKIASGYSGWGGFTTFYTNGSERARIDSSGNLLVGTTSTVGGASLIAGAFAGNAKDGFHLQDTTTTSGTIFAAWVNSSGTIIGSISRVATTNAVAYNTTSDERLKSNIEDSRPVLDKLMQVQVRQFDWTEGNLHQDYGFIAQELEPILSGVVTKGKTEEDFWQLDYSRLTPHLLKAIQEQQAIIESLKARLDAANL